MKNIILSVVLLIVMAGSTMGQVLPNTLGQQTALVVLVNFQDNPVQPYTAASVQDVVFNQTSGFWMENSFQQTWLTGDVAGWYTLPLYSTSCNVDNIATYAKQAAQNNGYVLASYNHFVIAFPSTTACPWWGYSYIGGVPSTSWINGQVQIKIVSHELGHALGLYHSHSLACGIVVYATSGCTQNEYGDSYDTMGNGNPMDYDSFQKERLGWLNYSAQPPITTVSSSGTYSISPYESQDNNPKALKILQSSGNFYYLESRQAVGYDGSYDFYIKNAVLFHIATPGAGNSSNLLNMTPTGPWYAPALAVGQSYTDSAAGVTITPTAVSNTGATVQVTMAAGPACTSANPNLSVSPSQSQWVVAGTTVTFTATVTDNDSSGCGSANFNFGSTFPAGWTGVWNTASLTLSPGMSGSATLQVTSPAGTPDGFYNVGVSAANASTPSYAASATATYVISTPVQLSIGVTANPASASPGQTVTVTVNVAAGSSPDAGASVTVTVTPPGGGKRPTQTILTGTTGSNGLASFAYKLNPHAASGTYQVQASTTSGNSNMIVANTTFQVQ